MRHIEIARSAVGLTQDDPAFHALCGPGEPPEKAKALAKKSTCALFLRGCLAYAALDIFDLDGVLQIAHGAHHDGLRPVYGALPPRLWAPYVDTMAMADLVAVCKQHNGVWIASAWNGTDGEKVKPGALIIVGTGGRHHVYLVETIHRDGWPDGSIELDAIEAGQVDDKGRQCVLRKRHEIGVDGLDRSEGRFGPVVKPVSWILDPSGLFA